MSCGNLETSLLTRKCVFVYAETLHCKLQLRGPKVSKIQTKRDCRVQTNAMAGQIVLVTNRDHEEVKVEQQVHRVDQTQVSHDSGASLSAVPQSCRTLLHNPTKKKNIKVTDESKVHTPALAKNTALGFRIQTAS